MIPITGLEIKGNCDVAASYEFSNANMMSINSGYQPTWWYHLSLSALLQSQSSSSVLWTPS